MADITIVGGDKLVKQIAKKVDKGKVNGVVKRSTAQVQQKAMRNAPVDTGFLKRSISIEMGDLEGRVTVGADYGAYLEYGTRFNAERPYLRPARNEQAPIFLKDLQNLIKRG